MRPAVTQADVIIVGAGPAGAACAAHLKQRGMDVKVLEKKTVSKKKAVCRMDLTGSVWLP
jgi:menaquinone-9 beta-reductase